MPPDSLSLPGATPAREFQHEVQSPPDSLTLGMPETSEAPQTVGSISVQGNVTTDSARIVRSFEVVSGHRFSDEAIRRGIRKLFALGVFSDVWVERVPVQERVDLVIHVKERPHISKVEVTGNKKRETSEVERKLTLHAGTVYSPSAVQTQIDSLLKYYRDEGFAQATIEAEADTLANNQVAVRFVIHEGERVKIGDIRVEGLHAFSDEKLRKQLKSKKRGLLGGGDIKEENFAEDKAKVEAWYHNHGYRDMRFTGHELVPGKSPKHLTLVIHVEEGPKYSIGNVSWTGNRIVPTPTVMRLWVPKPNEVYDASRIEKAQAGAYAEYAEQGYLYVGIEPREIVRDSTVDVAFTVTEGQPSKVRLVLISGNKGTREKVIRREISVHEGDRFKRSTLVRTQGDIMRLGLFEDCQIDFAPAESTDVDINLKVKEKQVGTASAGAGYTSASGLTGFLELGHNNVLGNGQSLQLHLERGGKRSDYYLSFTEPWFRDTPTLLGFSVYNTSTETNISSGLETGSDAEVRRGASVRIGRPLPWPDYSRGTLSYRLEKVSHLYSGLSAFALSNVGLGGVPNGTGLLTSAVEGVFSRSSTDNPFYPTKGTRLTIDETVAGGPLGGHVDFHKNRMEARAYLPSITKRFTTMLKGRFALLGPLGHSETPLPAYERFRLGGGTTLDPLRGYDDYEVVPSKFVRVVANSITVIDSTTHPGVIDTTTRILSYSQLRYPGGRFAIVYTVEQQFPIVHPLHGLFWFDAGNTWDNFNEIRPWDLKLGTGVGFRFEIPLLGNIGFDYGYGFDHEELDQRTGKIVRRPHFKGHFLIGNVIF